MTLDGAALRLQLNGAPETDEQLKRFVDAAKAHVERQLGFKLDNPTEFPDGTPADLEMAVLQLAAHWYENREATLVGVTAQSIPLGVDEIVGEYRNYTFGLPNEGASNG